MKTNHFAISIFLISLFLLSACSKNNTVDGDVHMVSDHTKKYHGNYFFTTVTLDNTKGVAVNDTIYYHGTIQKHTYFAHIGIQYKPDEYIWMDVDTIGNFTFPYNNASNSCWSGQFINDHEVNIVYDSLPFFSKHIHGVRE